MRVATCDEPPVSATEYEEIMDEKAKYKMIGTSKDLFMIMLEPFYSYEEYVHLTYTPSFMHILILRLS
jgi:hypothetical protein